MTSGVVKVPKIYDGVKIDNTLIGADVMRQRVEVYSGETLPVGITADGNTAHVMPYSTAITSNMSALMTQTVIHGKTTAGGSSYVDVKVNPSGALTVDATVSGTVSVSGNVEIVNDVGNAIPISGSLGSGNLILDAWGTQKMSLPYSVFHGMWSYDIPPNQWFMYENGTQVYTSTNITSSSGAALLSADSTKHTLVMESRECPRYQPNRGHLFSTALWCPNKTNNGIREWGVKTTENGVYFRLRNDGKLYAVRRSGNSEIVEEEITTTGVSNFDVQKGNVYDIQYQWRGVGNYKFFINLVHVHTFSNLGSLTALSMQNPALPAYFACQRVTQDVTMHIGCCDITSENGLSDSEEYGMAYAGAVATTGTDKPVLVIYNPLQINSVTNTRTINIASFTVNSNKKSVFKIWRTRAAGDITGATFKVIGNGSYIQTDSPNMDATAVRATAVTTANMKLQLAIPVEASVMRQVDTPNQGVIQFNMVRGDYLVITNDGTTATSDVVIKWGEEI